MCIYFFDGDLNGMETFSCHFPQFAATEKRKLYKAIMVLQLVFNNPRDF